jgi:DNA primase
VTWLDDFVHQAETRLGEPQREALWARGVTDKQIASFRIGYVNHDLPQANYPKPFLDWAFRGSKLENVFVLPLTNVLGDIRGLQFRNVDRDRSGYRDFIPEKGEAILFGLGQAAPHMWETKGVFLVEGAFDLFPVQRFYPAVVATLTARVVAPLLRVMRRVVDFVWIGYDMDSTGRRACAKFACQHQHDFQGIRVVNYPKVAKVGGGVVKDPGDLWEAWGDPSFEKFIRSEITQADPGKELFDAQGIRSR